MDNNAFGEVQSATNFQQELTATSKVTKKVYNFEFWQIDWDSKNEVTDTILIMPRTDSCVTVSVQYSTIDFNSTMCQPL